MKRFIKPFSIFVAFIGLLMLGSCDPIEPLSKTYTVIFKANGGSGTMEPQTFTIDVEKALAPNAFTRENHTFTGWNTAANGSGISYADMQRITIDEDLTLYAQWQANSTMPEGVVVHFTFEGNANDVSGNENHAMVHDATLTEDRFGNPNCAYDFNGASSYLDFMPSESMNQIFETEEITISSWFKIRNWYQNWNVFAIFEQYDSATDGGSILLEANWGSGGILFIPSDGANYVTADFQWEFDRWYNLTVTCSKQNSTASFYIDGILIDTKTFDGEFTPDYENSYAIGRSLSGPDEYSDGVIDDFIIFKRALTSEEVQELFESQSIH